MNPIALPKQQRLIADCLQQLRARGIDTTGIRPDHIRLGVPLTHGPRVTIPEPSPARLTGPIYKTEPGRHGPIHHRVAPLGGCQVRWTATY